MISFGLALAKQADKQYACENKYTDFQVRIIVWLLKYNDPVPDRVSKNGDTYRVRKICIVILPALNNNENSY